MNKVQMASDDGRNVNGPTASGLAAGPESANDHEMANEVTQGTAFIQCTRTTVFYLLIMATLIIGWQNRGNVYITPEEGPGYALGIIGGTMMLLLLMYPVRKHLPWTHSLGPVRHWFRAHMLMGILGPVCILYHCNFQLGSTNGNIALFSMLLVAGSGLVGRYFYTKIHFGLYGKKADLARLGSDAAMARSSMDKVFEAAPKLHARMQKLEKRAVRPPTGFLSGMLRVVTVNVGTYWLAITSAPALRQSIANSAWYAKLPAAQRRIHYRRSRYYLHGYLGAVRKVAGLAFYERLFSLWHILHLPLFIMLVICGSVHVYAVHLY